MPLNKSYSQKICRRSTYKKTNHGLKLGLFILFMLFRLFVLFLDEFLDDGDGANEILICTPARVLVVGAEDEM